MQKSKKVISGIVVSNKMDKGIIVKIEILKKDPQFKKTIKGSKKFYADDPKNECREGDKVQIINARPLSKLKRYRLLKVLETVR